MREANKALAKTALTRADIELGKSPEIKELKKMLHTGIYEFRVRLALYKKGKLSARGLLLNDDIYNLPLGKKDLKGVILIDNDVMDLLGRFKLTNNLAEKGDPLTAFMVEHDDKLYELFKDMKDMSQEDRVKDDEYIQLFNIAYNRISSKIVDHAMSTAFDENPELRENYIKVMKESAAAEQAKKTSVDGN